MDEENIPAHQCIICEKTFTKSSNLYMHQRKIHGVEPVFSKNEIVCSLCEAKFRSKALYEQHLEIEHEIKLTKSELKFKSFDEFTEWKKQTEQSTNSEYVKKCGVKRKEKEKASYFYCHRSGVFESTGDGKRSTKFYGSNRLNSNCPSMMKVIEKEHEIHIEFTETHVGHKNAIGKLHISEDDKLKICAQLQQKIPISTILDNIRDTNSANYDRRYLITRKDIHNIKQEFNINDDGVLDSNDAESVKKWVDSFDVDDTPVVLFKQQGLLNPSFPELAEKDFLLIIMNEWQKKMLNMFGSDIICMDFTHGLNNYDFDMATLLVVDEKREGFPSAFIFSNRHDSALLSIALTAIKNCGVNVSPKTFMSDDDNTFYNAWRKVFAETENRLLCTWHVERSWKKKLNELCSNHEDQKLIYERLTCVLTETDEEAFKRLLPSFVDFLKSKASMSDFALYFVSNYANRPKMWAYCYRLWSGINTNMYVESFHKVIKYMYLDGEKIERLDKTINVIMKFIRDKVYDRLIMLERGKISSKLSTLRERHGEILKVPTDEILETEDGWIVPSFSHSLIKYTVKKQDECSKKEICPLKCVPCGYCLHSFTCTCLDNCNKYNMCKHIHLVCKKIKEFAKALPQSKAETSIIGREEPFNGDLIIEDSDPQKEETEDLISALKPKTTSTNDLKQNIHSICQKILKSVDACSSLQKLKSAYKIMQNANEVLSEDSATEQNQFITPKPTKDPPNKNINSQRYVSTKKKLSRKQNFLSKPSAEKSLNIACSLLLSASADTNSKS